MNQIDSLRRLPFELAYLALLTSYRIKPLSRWESALDEREIDILARLGLEIAAVERRAWIGRRLRNVAFSRSPRYAREYRKKFDGKRLGRSAAETKLEGWFFGYPSCCVERFARTPYAPNFLSPRDQRILFHWACPDCAATASILGEYRRVHAECVRIMGGEPAWNGLKNGRPERARGAVAPWAASIAALAMFHSLYAAAEIDPHVLPAPDDADGDGLAYAEERLFGACPTIADVDGNTILDGVDFSAALHSIISSLPDSPGPAPYKIEVPMDGVEQCAICGAWFNMGYYEIHNPDRGLVVNLPVIGLHYLEHGSVGYDGSYHGVGRADIEGLKTALFPTGISSYYHDAYRYVESDSDGDTLGDNEETLLGTDPADPDTDGDSLRDDRQTAERLLAQLSSLPREERPDGPYVVDHEERGLETCSTCGHVMNMGYLEVVNPLEGMTLEVHYVSLHYLAHGCFGASGDVHATAELLPSVLDVALNGAGGAHLLPVADDGDGDGLTDDEEQSLGFDKDDPDTDNDGTPDGADLAFVLHEYIGTLPVCDYGDPEPEDRIFVRPFVVYGTYSCLVCGETINMGWMKIVNPMKGTEFDLPYLSFHFMEHGGFSTDRPDQYPRVDVAALVGTLDLSVAGADVSPPARAVLSSAPNPFGASTKISLAMPSAADIGVAVFDAAGRKVRDLHSGRVPAGASEFVWDGRDDSGRELASGVYFCKIRCGSMTLSKKLVKVK